MSVDMNRMKKLGLDSMFDKEYRDEKAYQISMAAKLRALTFQYLRGDFAGKGVEDGPQVIELRTNLNATGTMNEFVGSQSKDRAWATYLELTLLAELLGTNFAVKMSGGAKNPTILTANPSEHKPTITLVNENNTHWSASIDGSKKSTLGDGNCGYNAFALSLASMTRKELSTVAAVSSAAKIIQQEESVRLRASIEQAKTAEEQCDAAMQKIKKDSPDKYKLIQTQIHDDYQVALKLAMDDLPDVYGKTDIAVKDYCRLLEQKLKITYCDDEEAPKVSFAP